MSRRVKKATGGEPCVAQVHLSASETGTRRRREYLAKAAGLPAVQCGRRSTHIIDRQPVCSNHAGQRALKILMGEES